MFILNLLIYNCKTGTSTDTTNRKVCFIPYSGLWRTESPPLDRNGVKSGCHPVIDTYTGNWNWQKKMTCGLVFAGYIDVYINYRGKCWLFLSCHIRDLLYCNASIWKLSKWRYKGQCHPYWQAALTFLPLAKVLHYQHIYCVHSSDPQIHIIPPLLRAEYCRTKYYYLSALSQAA